MRWNRGKARGGVVHTRLPSSAAGVQTASAHQRSAAVASRSSQNHHMFACGIAIEKAHPGEVSEVTPGVLHHLDQLDAHLLYHGPVYLDHLFGGQGRHLAFIDGDHPRLSLLAGWRCCHVSSSPHLADRCICLSQRVSTPNYSHVPYTARCLPVLTWHKETISPFFTSLTPPGKM